MMWGIEAMPHGLGILKQIYSPLQCCVFVLIWSAVSPIFPFEGDLRSVRRRESDGCPVAGALQMIGDKWTMLIVRDLASGPKRTTELLSMLHPISSRTLVGRLRDMQRDRFVERTDYGGNPPRVEYVLTERGRLLFPFLAALKQLGQTLGCNECEDRKELRGQYCEACPHNDAPAPPAPRRRRQDDSIVLL